MKIARALVLLASLAVGVSCGPTPSTSSPTPTATATASASPAPTATQATRLTPLQAADLLRKSIAGTRPLLIPASVPDTWLADVKIESATSFTATYREPAGTKTFTLTLAVANPPLPTATTVQSHPLFHGDASSLYQVADGTDPASGRFLIWVENGVWPGWPQQGVPYLVSTTGIGETEFWQLTNGLHPDQIGG